MRNDVNRQLLIEQRVTNEAKSPLVAYLLLFLLWGFGVHRMYLGRWASGIFMLILWGLGLLTAWILVGWIPLALVSVWVVIDIFLIPGMIQDDNAVNRQRMMAETAR
ncbi:TM2 domain-containing protein [Paracoccus caeni]|uniref:TM2 domain-containing protein n=1 Tax=Paracoccus caeni TaxID=657651 RepID=A0A934SHT4_9RHOB|nr:TM2 domain-containing protein [Paracoccus caeni]MBK4217331.1 TM2 domain-containing protein [Paracoccus caeni]